MYFHAAVEAGMIIRYNQSNVDDERRVFVPISSFYKFILMRQFSDCWLLSKMSAGCAECRKPSSFKKNRFHYWRSPNNGWAGQRSLDPTHKNLQFLALPKHVQTAVLFSLPTGRLQSYGLWSNTGRISQLNIIRMRIWEIVFEILPLFCLLQKINILLKITV